MTLNFGDFEYAFPRSYEIKIAATSFAHRLARSRDRSPCVVLLCVRALPSYDFSPQASRFDMMLRCVTPTRSNGVCYCEVLLQPAMWHFIWALIVARLRLFDLHRMYTCLFDYARVISSPVIVRFAMTLITAHEKRHRCLSLPVSAYPADAYRA